MCHRGLNLGSDIDIVANASAEELDDKLKKYITTKNVKPDTALRWAIQRATSASQKQLLSKKFDEYYQSGNGLI